MEREFEEFYKETYPLVHNYVKKHAPFKSDIDDIMQEIYYIAWMKKDIILTHQNVQGWIMLIAKHKLFKFSEKRYKEFSQSVNTEDGEESLAGEEINSIYATIELEQVVTKSLTDVERALFYEYYIEGYTKEELAQKYLVPSGGFKMRMKRIREKIKVALS